jgi:hypothetical protein
MRRKLFTLAAGVSAVLCVLLIVVWIWKAIDRRTQLTLFDLPEFAYTGPFQPNPIPAEPPIPWLALVAVTALLPTVWVLVARPRRAWRHGLCPACGYDLRATPDRCPECGAVPAAAKGERA